jgi:hypothetical protein
MPVKKLVDILRAAKEDKSNRFEFIKIVGKEETENAE